MCVRVCVCACIRELDEHWAMVLIPNIVLMKIEKQEEGRKEGILEGKERQEKPKQGERQGKNREKEERNKKIYEGGGMRVERGKKKCKKKKEVGLLL